MPMTLQQQIDECIKRGKHASVLYEDYKQRCADAWDKFYNGRNMTHRDRDMWSRNAQQYAAARDMWKAALENERTTYTLLTQDVFSARMSGD